MNKQTKLLEYEEEFKIILPARVIPCGSTVTKPGGRGQTIHFTE